MADLSLHTDARYLHARWDFQFAVFKIVARDYRAVLDGTRNQELHRDILIQTVADLLDTEAGLTRRAQPSPAADLDPPDRELWLAAVSWVRELHRWRIPPADLPLTELGADLVLRKELEEQFNAAVRRGEDEPAADGVCPPAVVRVTPPGSFV